MNSFKNFWKNAFNFSGIATRADMWWTFLFNFIILFVLGLIDYRIRGIYGVIIFIPQISLSVRRLHDTGHTARPLIVVYAIEVICLILMAINKLFNWIPVLNIFTTLIFVVIPFIIILIASVYLFIMCYCLGSKYPPQNNMFTNQPYENNPYNNPNNPYDNQYNQQYQQPNNQNNNTFH